MERGKVLLVSPDGGYNFEYALTMVLYWVFPVAEPVVGGGGSELDGGIFGVRLWLMI